MHCNVQLCQTHYQPFCSSLYQWCHHCTRGVRYTTNKSVYNCTNGVTLPTSPFITVTVGVSYTTDISVRANSVIIHYQCLPITVPAVSDTLPPSVPMPNIVPSVSEQYHHVFIRTSVCPSLYQQCQVHYHHVFICTNVCPSLHQRCQVHYHHVFICTTVCPSLHQRCQVHYHHVFICTTVCPSLHQRCQIHYHHVCCLWAVGRQSSTWKNASLPVNKGWVFSLFWFADAFFPPSILIFF